jgi:hypothetical protein
LPPKILRRQTFQDNDWLGQFNIINIHNNNLDDISYVDQTTQETSIIGYSDQVPSEETSIIGYSDQVPSQETSIIDYSDQVPIQTELRSPIEFPKKILQLFAINTFYSVVMYLIFILIIIFSMGKKK